jgi:hypothetical protein
MTRLLAHIHTKHRQAQDEGAAEEETAAVRANAIVKAAGKSPMPCIIAPVMYRSRNA